MKQRALAVDLGATWLRAALSVDGRVVKRWKRPAVRWTELARELRRLKAGRPDLLTAGATGVWSQANRRLFARSLRPLARRVRALSDAEMAHEAAFAAGPGVLVIAGTGAIALGKDARGRTARAGGLGALLGDEGSGFWIGREALREPRLAKSFPENLALKLAHEPKPIRAIAALAPEVLRLARRNPAARRILDENAAHLAGLVRRACRELKLASPVPVSFHGSVFNDPMMRARFLKLLGHGFSCRPSPRAPELAVARIIRR